MNSIQNKERIRIIPLIGSILQKEGLQAMFKGWLPAYLRLGPHALICFPVFEQIRRLLGLNYI